MLGIDEMKPENKLQLASTLENTPAPNSSPNTSNSPRHSELFSTNTEF